MSNSTTLLDTLTSNQASKEITANALFDAASPSTLWGRRASTCCAHDGRRRAPGSHGLWMVAAGLAPSYTDSDAGQRWARARRRGSCGARRLARDLGRSVS